MPVLCRYLLLSAVFHLVWEIAQLPLYTVFSTGSAAEIAFDVIHCTVGDVLIALTTFALAVSLVQASRNTSRGYVYVAALTVMFGVVYTVYSEWLNVSVRESWAYATAMPRLPVLGTGLAPLLQWVVVPSMAFWITARKARQVL